MPNVGQFIVVKLATKKCLKHFIERIEEVHRPEVVIRYLRQKKENCFVFPVQDGISLEDEDNIVEFLRPPDIRRGLHTFKVNVTKYKF